MGKMSLTSCRALSTPGKFSNVDRYALLDLDVTQSSKDGLNWRRSNLSEIMGSYFHVICIPLVASLTRHPRLSSNFKCSFRWNMLLELKVKLKHTYWDQWVNDLTLAQAQDIWAWAALSQFKFYLETASSPWEPTFFFFGSILGDTSWFYASSHNHRYIYNTYRAYRGPTLLSDLFW